MFDLFYLALTLALFALAALVAKGVELMGPRARVADQRDPDAREERA